VSIERSQRALATDRDALIVATSRELLRLTPGGEPSRIGSYRIAPGTLRVRDGVVHAGRIEMDRLVLCRFESGEAEPFLDELVLEPSQ
jgi:hypothetical protein